MNLKKYGFYSSLSFQNKLSNTGDFLWGTRYKPSLLQNNQTNLMTGCQEMLENAYFTSISPFLAKQIFFSKIRLHQSLGAVKSYLDTKNQKILMSRSSGIFRTN